ncbi:sensor histidine kinase [Clostridium grantii]|uniref:histidine kinase n=1 Tax=Clostridium grantii DSM 8605 TaxID=1121316 RepID=A0A1M5S3L7_9CLOT|nr:sensor histidine kinase [Clostridium grantii]SHH33045.1 Signal transduction histidine kinase [Clostridium grantii DSM 8605]
MENKIRNSILIINYFFLTIIMIATAISNINKSTIIIFLYLIILSLYTVKTYFAYNDKRASFSFCVILTYVLEILITFYLQYYDVYFLSFIVLCLIVEDVALNLNKKASLLVTFNVYIISCIILYIKLNENMPFLVITMLLLCLLYTIIYIIFFLIKYLFKQNEIIDRALKDITIKNLEKENMYKNLKEAYSKVEVVTALKERNKIAAEIHDTVGHTLTTVLVELEASKRLMNKNMDKAIEKLNLAQGQVRKGLNEIRSSVRVIEKGEDALDFFESLEAFIESTEKNSDIIIKTQIDNSMQIYKKAETVIFSSLMEGLSNGIRHGNSTAFLFKLYREETQICFSLEDNGTGSPVISPGFGLRAMKNRVIEINGEFQVDSKEGEGFGIYITLPQ